MAYRRITYGTTKAEIKTLLRKKVQLRNQESYYVRRIALIKALFEQVEQELSSLEQQNKERMVTV